MPDTLSDSLNESRFYMWRTVVAMAHADGVVTPQELSFINDYVRDINLSQEQLDIIGQDILNPQDISKMFSKITKAQDKTDFFALARALSWCDGDYDAQEKAIIESLEQADLMAVHQEAIEKSRELINEVTLDQNQWSFTTERSRNLFGFLAGKKARTA